MVPSSDTKNELEQKKSKHLAHRKKKMEMEDRHEGMEQSPMFLDGNVHFSICQQKDDLVALWRAAYERSMNEIEMVKAENRSLKSHMKAMKAEYESRAR